MKRAALALALALTLLLPPTTSRPAAAGLCGAFKVIFGSDPCGTTGQVPPTCGITNVGASASNGGNGHHYDFVMLDSCQNVHVVADYDVTSGRATETLTDNLGVDTITAVFFCQPDPWISRLDAWTCRFDSRTTSWVDTDPDPQFPASVMVLSATDRDALNGQLQSAIKQLPGLVRFPQWTMLDNNAAARDIVADGDKLYQRWNNGQVWQYMGTPCYGTTCFWQQLDNNYNTAQIAAAGGHLYQRWSGGGIWYYTGLPCQAQSCMSWTQMDDNAGTVWLAAGGDDLYQLHSDGTIWKHLR